MNIIHINPLRPFEKMARKNDFREMVINSLSDVYALNTVAKSVVSIAVHHAYDKNPNPVFSDVITGIREMRHSSDASTSVCDELCLMFSFAFDPVFPEYNIFCDKDGHSLDNLDVDGLKAVLGQASNQKVRSFLERLVICSLYF